MQYRIQTLVDHFSSAENLRKMRYLEANISGMVNIYTQGRRKEGKKKGRGEGEGRKKRRRERKNHHPFFHIRHHISVPTTKNGDCNQINCIQL